MVFDYKSVIKANNKKFHSDTLHQFLDPKYWVEVNKEQFEVLILRCNGVKTCSKCPNVYPVSCKKKLCKTHGEQLEKIGCEVKFYQLKKRNEALFFFTGDGIHSHDVPPPNKVDKDEEQAIVLSFQQNPTLTPKQALLGVGTHDLPYLRNPALLNISKYQNFKRKALLKVSMDNPNPMSTLFKVEQEIPILLKEYFEKESFTIHVSDLMTTYMRQFYFNGVDTFAVIQFPIQSLITNSCDFLVIDLKHASKSGPFTNCLGISSYIDTPKGGLPMHLSRILMDNFNYYQSFKLWLITLADDGVDLTDLFKNQLKGILIDFSQSQLAGLKKAVAEYVVDGEMLITKLASGCFVHFLRSVKRAIKTLSISEEHQKLILELAKTIQFVKTKKEIVSILDSIVCIASSLGSWRNWWIIPEVLNLLHSASHRQNPEIVPDNTNNQEILHAVDVPCYFANALVECAMLLKHDILAVSKFVGLNQGFKISNISTTKEDREKRNDRRKELKNAAQTAKYDSRPPDSLTNGLEAGFTSVDVLKSFVSAWDKTTVTELGEILVDDEKDEDFLMPVSPNHSSSKSTSSPSTPKAKKKRKRSPKAATPTTSSNSATSPSFSRQLREIAKQSSSTGTSLPRNLRPNRFSLPGRLQ
ncbi:predicted protein [Naegleria gruberi]|uniref:Predicted protein n=1 Tax=Naegleria gruberi TaxID=5762 RepID=D2W4N5_NAEGR|nr:uncharacterized protein NAEGRDRAFT_76370 [Naegleria gruberi]EFC35965.1 predicted protein [Naegleria gruberi]|eukprot:XP_002668709.1 predicted protein [Naegleria gruberi strain NEG-M]